MGKNTRTKEAKKKAEIVGWVNGSRLNSCSRYPLRKMRSMSVRYAVALLPVAIMVLLFTGVARDFFHKDEAKQPASEGESSFEKLGIEKISPDGLAPDFALKDIRGKTVRLQELEGKVVFLNFWATWCPPCVLEMPAMEKLHQEYDDKGLVILAINFRERPEDIKAFLDEHRLTFTILLNPDGNVFELYRAWGLPSSIIINKKGEVVGKATGYRDWHSAEAKTFFQQLLQENWQWPVTVKSQQKASGQAKRDIE